MSDNIWLLCYFCRWNSTYYMLDRLLENKRAVVLYSTETPIVILSSNEWSLMEKVLRLLQPFEEYTKLMSKNNSCISEVIPAVTVLKKFLSRDDGEKISWCPYNARRSEHLLREKVSNNFCQQKLRFGYDSGSEIQNKVCER